MTGNKKNYESGKNSPIKVQGHCFSLNQPANRLSNIWGPVALGADRLKEQEVINSKITKSIISINNQ